MDQVPAMRANVAARKRLSQDYCVFSQGVSEMPCGWLSKMMVPFWIPIIIQHLIFRVPKKGS